MTHSREISQLNSLVSLHYDRIACYAQATDLLAPIVKGLDAAPFFAQLAQGCLHAVKELTAEIKRLGGVPTEGQTLAGKTLLLWMEVQTAVSGDGLQAIMGSCLRMNRLAVRGYERAIGSQAAFSDSMRQYLLDHKIGLEATSTLIQTYKKLQNSYLISEHV
ncbi:DUF2383 domain-containing protein [Fulvivirgaceae bacterium PWU5]|uniref:DUF2383 domain-containing protein n=1 Tax=Dawidia cretensis TaxID=2782350 RepID=A0AAP2GQN1_9BACT|nr:DUF2383 domain-containing protein [Dawidia cretensis]MBT1709841.1 DUF2383 domain-containing protein [Dawidia cretensis]